MVEPITTTILFTVLAPVATFVIGILWGAIVKKEKTKRVLNAVRNFVDTIDDAVYDDQVTEAEFRKGWDTGVKIIRELES